MASVEGDIRVPAQADVRQAERARQGGLLRAAAVATRRRHELIDAVFAGRAGPRRATDLIEGDSARLNALAAGLTRRRHPRARLAVVRIRPAGWRLPLWIPVPMFALRFAAGLASRRMGAIEAFDTRALAETLRALPRCGKVVDIEDQSHSVEIWLL